MPNSTPGILTNGVTITQVLANAGAKANENFGSSLDLDRDGIYDHSDEYVAITNFSDAAVNVSGWQIWASTAGGAAGFRYHTFSSGTTLAPGQTIYVITEYAGNPPAGVVEANGTGASTFGAGTNQLHDGVDGEIALVNTTNPNNIEYVQFTMDSSPEPATGFSGFPKNANGTLAKQITGDASQSNPLVPTAVKGYIKGWQDLYGINDTAKDGLAITYDPKTGTVGYVNGATPNFPGTTTNQAGINLNGITFRDVLPDNNGAGGFDIDGDGASTNADQFVSFVNTTNASVDISGYQVWSTTQADGDTTVYRYHTFVNGTVLKPGEVIYVVTEYSGNPSLRNERIVEANGTITDNNSQLLRANADGEIALLQPGSQKYIQFTFDATPANLAAQSTFPGSVNQGTIHAVSWYAGGNQPTNSDTYRYDHSIGIVTEIPQTVALAVCFTRSTRIRTRAGDVAVHCLQPGQEVLTLDNGYQPIRWIGSRQLGTVDLLLKPALRPIRIRAGALGPRQPENDLIVSPQHRVLVRSAIARRMFGVEEVLVAAKHLLEIPGVEIVDDLKPVEYWHFMFDRHEVVFAEMAPVESLYTGSEALKSVSPAARQEILTLFPALAEGLTPKPVRPLVSGRLGRSLAQRHATNRKVLLMAPQRMAG